MAKEWKENFKGPKLMSSLGTLTSGITGIVSSAMGNADIADNSAIENSIQDTLNTNYNYNDYDSLEAAYNPFLLQKDNYIGEDVRGISKGRQALNIGAATLAGATAGSVIPGIGTVIGAGVGAVAGTVGSLIGKGKANRVAAENNKLATTANTRMLTNYSNNAEMISDNNFNDAAINISAFGGTVKSNPSRYYGFDDNFAYGGNLDLSGDYSNGVTIIGEGGTHEENPNQGVQIGIDENGIPNLVEEGEVIFNDYVFSNRLTAPEKLLEEVHLNKKFADKPFSEIAKKLQTESSENPFDPISRNTLNDSLSKLAILQEDIRAKKYQEEFNEFANGGEVNKFAPGGYTWNTFIPELNNFGISKTQRYGNTYDYNRSMSPEEIRAIEGSNSYRGFTDYILNNSTDANVIKYLRALDANTAAGTSKLFNGNSLVSNWKDIFNERRTDGKYGVYHLTPQDVMTKDGTLPKVSAITPKVGANGLFSGPAVRQNEPTALKGLDSLSTKGGNNNKLNKLSGITRFAPVINSGISFIGDLLGNNRNDYTNANIVRNARRNIRDVSGAHIGNYMAYNPFDINYEQNRLANQSLNTRNAVLSSTSGNRGAALASLIALNGNTNTSMGDLFRRGLEYNDQQRKMVTDFNRGTDIQNANFSMQAQQANQNADAQRANLALREALMRDQIETQMSNVRSQNRNAFVNNLYNLGMDNYYGNQADWWRNYVAPVNDATRQYPRGFGGKIKRGFTF